MSQAIEIQSTLVDVLDVNNKKIYNGISIDKLLSKFKCSPLVDNPGTFVFEDYIKIRDLLGWTVLKEITLITKKLCPLLLRIDDKKIITCTSILMPVYNPTDMREFHGNAINRFSTKHFNEFTRNSLFAFIDYRRNKLISLKRMKKIIPYSNHTKKIFYFRSGKPYFATIKTSTGTATFNGFHWLTELKEK